MTHDVFVSHARKDQRIADAICEKLESIGESCWLTARDISPGEDWTQVTRNAIESSRLMVLVLSENANGAPHIEREIAHAFYTKRAILPVRLTQTPPPRDLLFYLGGVRWFEVFGAPAESLEALAATIDGMIRDRIDPRGYQASPSGIKTATTLDISNTSTGTLRSSHNRTLKILKSAAIGGCLFAVASLFAFWPWQTEREDSSEEAKLHSMRSVPSGSMDPSARTTGDASASKPQDTFSSTPDTAPASATPSLPTDDQKPVGDGENDTASARSWQGDTTRMSNQRQGRQGKPRSKRHNGRVSKSQGSRFADILRTFWRKIVAKSK
jgi:TIR domain